VAFLYAQAYAASASTFLRAGQLAELVAEHDLPLRSYEVLLLLQDAPHRRLRMSDLSRSALVSPSGVTRLVDRLEREGRTLDSGEMVDLWAGLVVLGAIGAALNGVLALIERRVLRWSRV